MSSPSAPVTVDSVMGVYSTVSVTRYAKLGKIGEGTYGTVYRARDTLTNQIVALKKIRVNTEQSKSGFPLTSLREIALLRSLRHENVIGLLTIAVGRQPSSVFLVFELCPTDLASVFDREAPARSNNGAGANMLWTLSQVKRLVHSILSGVSYLHSRYVFHRDLKLSNVLLTHSGDVKIADFGLARVFSNPLQSYTPRVVTLWYRAPELLLQAMSAENKSQSHTNSNSSTSGERREVDYYHSAIDIWSCGCIMAELLLGRPLVPGNNETEQISMICRLLGTPTTKIWPAFRHFGIENDSDNDAGSGGSVSGGMRLPHYPYSALQHTLVSAQLDVSASCCNLVSRMLTYDPSKRITAAKALLHPWFNEAPAMAALDSMLTFNAPQLAGAGSETPTLAPPPIPIETGVTAPQHAEAMNAAASATAERKRRRVVEVNIGDIPKKSRI